MQTDSGTTKRLVASALAALIFLPGLALASGGAKYKVTIYNLTAGQPLTPPVIAVHNKRTGIFSVGDEASKELQQIAENGNNAPLVAALHDDVNVRQVIEGTAPIVPANRSDDTGFDSSATFWVTTDGRARFLSWVSMLICTNDGFAGVNTIRLPYWKTVVHVNGYETRSEDNTEDFKDMVPPCQGLIGVMSDDAGTGMSDPLLAEDGVIIPHAGVQGGADLQPKYHDWADPVARIVIERVRRHDDDDSSDDD